MEKVKRLVAAGADVNRKDKRGGTPLFHAVIKPDTAVAEYLIAQGADVNGRVFDGNGGASYQYMTPLHSALRIGYLDMVSLLIVNGADVNAMYQSGIRPLHHASALGQKAVVELLLAYDADVNAKNKKGRTALHAAAVEGHTVVPNCSASAIGR